MTTHALEQLKQPDRDTADPSRAVTGVSDTASVAPLSTEALTASSALALQSTAGNGAVAGLIGAGGAAAGMKDLASGRAAEIGSGTRELLAGVGVGAVESDRVASQVGEPPKGDGAPTGP